MSPLKQKIFEEVKKVSDAVTDMNDDELNKLLFKHPGGLRLTLAGFIIVKKIFTAYSFEFEDVKNKHRMALSKMEFPYFFTGRRLVLFSEMDATVIKLRGSVKEFLECYE